LETAFDQVRKGKAPATRELIAVALAARDQMRALIEQPETASAERGEAILRDLQQLMNTPAASAPAAAAPVETAPAAGRTTWRVRFGLPKDAMATGTNPLLLLDELRSLGTATVVALTERVPPLEELDPTQCHLCWSVMLTTEQSRETIEQVFLFL